MKKLFVILTALMVATPVFAACENPKVPADIAQKLEAVPLQMTTFDKNGFDVPDEYIENALAKYKEWLTESCFIISADGLPVVSKITKDGALNLAIEVSVNGKMIGTIEPNKPFGFNQANKFGSGYMLLMRRLLGPAILRGDLKPTEHGATAPTANREPS